MTPDATHDPARRSWVRGADGHPDFPIQNLPLGRFSPRGDTPRTGVAIGDHILDLGRIDHPAAARAATGSLNDFLSLGPGPRRELRAALAALLDAASPARPDLLHRADQCDLHLPMTIGDYTDFYAGIHHARHVGALFRPDAPLLPNYAWVPIGYHGRASSVVVSGAPIRRPNGQRKPATETVPSFGPSRNLDFELELGIWIGPGNEPGEPILIGEAADHVAGFCLLNDWSARDVQGWEYQPLGPFLAKNFATSVSPWVVTPEALAPFRIPQAPREPDQPAPLAYLWSDADQQSGAYDIGLEVLLMTPGLAEAGLPPVTLSRSNAKHLFWTVAQMVAHHASGGCNLRPGDLFGTGTISAPERSGLGSLLELSEGGRRPVSLPSGEVRRFLEDGDEVILRATCRRDGFAQIAFGDCRGKIIPAV